MHRGLLLSLAAGLLTFLAGCHHCAGRCDCLVQPIDHGTPSPTVHPGPIVSPPGPIASPTPIISAPAQ